MSKPVTRAEVGWNIFSSLVLSGQPKVEKVHRAEENQVSKTSGSLVSFTSAESLYLVRTSSSLWAT